MDRERSRLHHGFDRALAREPYRGIEEARDDGDEDGDDGVVPVRVPHLDVLLFWWFRLA